MIKYHSALGNANLDNQGDEVMQNETPNIGHRLLLGILLISLSLFAYQVALTRLYSAILSHHYVFLTTSFAVLGVGIGSVLAYRDSARLGRILGVEPGAEKVLAFVGKLATLLSFGFVCVFVLIYIQPFVDALMIYIALGLIPFVLSGYLFAMLFKLWPNVSGKMYFADLIGAGAGSILIVALLNSGGMFRTAAVVCLLPLAAAWLLPSTGKLVAARVVLTVLFAVALFLPSQMTGVVETNFHALLNNSGKTFGEMQRNGLNPQIIYSRWDSFARTDLIKIPDIPQLKILTIDGAANAPMYEFDGDVGNLDHFKSNVGFIPFAMGRSENALIIGAGGGRGVLYSLAGGAIDIAAVEINQASIDAVRLFGDFNGNIFDRPEVRTYAQDGRNFIRTTDERFDVIFLSLVVTNTTQGAGFALSENYIHTVEAMQDYLGRLSEGGRVAFVTHDHGALIRLTSTAMQALMNLGIQLEDTPNHIALYHQITGAEMLNPTIIIKSQPFTEQESTALRSELTRAGLTPAHLPHLNEWPPLGAVGSGVFSFAQFLDTFEMRATPVTDNSPYFFHFERGVPPVLLQILALSLAGLALLLLPHMKKRGHLKPAAYFGLLGMGFMMIQITLIQMFILYLGHPTLAFSYVLAAMLVGCGIGGVLSGRNFLGYNTGRVYMPPLIAAVICLVLLPTLPVLFQMTAGLSIAGKVALASLVVMIPGFFMGMPFPRGLTLLGEKGKREIIPVMWGINGVASVIGSAVSIILSMSVGFTVALVVGAVIYVVVGLLGEV